MCLVLYAHNCTTTRTFGGRSSVDQGIPGDRNFRGQMDLFGLDVVCPIDSNGRFVVSPFASVVRTCCSGSGFVTCETQLFCCLQDRVLATNGTSTDVFGFDALFATKENLSATGKRKSAAIIHAERMETRRELEETLATAVDAEKVCWRSLFGDSNQLLLL